PPSSPALPYTTLFRSRASPEELGVLYWIVLVVSFAGVAWSGVLAVERLFFRRRVAFTSTSLLLPKPWSFWQEEAIDYQAITGLEDRKSTRLNSSHVAI